LLMWQALQPALARSATAKFASCLLLIRPISEEVPLQHALSCPLAPRVLNSWRDEAMKSAPVRQDMDQVVCYVQSMARLPRVAAIETRAATAIGRIFSMAVAIGSTGVTTHFRSGLLTERSRVGDLL
jgi:hypothetical protein